MAAIFFDAAAFGLSAFGQESNTDQHESQIALSYNYTHPVMEPREVLTVSVSSCLNLLLSVI